MVKELEFESDKKALGYRQFVSAEPQIKSGAKGSADNPFDSRQNALEECKNQIVATGNKELQSKDVVFNFGFVYVKKQKFKKQKYWIIYIKKALKNLPRYLNWGYNILTYKEIEAGTTSGSSPLAQTIWDILGQEGLVEYPQEVEIFGPTFDTPEKNSDRERSQSFRTGETDDSDDSDDSDSDDSSSDDDDDSDSDDSSSDDDDDDDDDDSSSDDDDDSDSEPPDDSSVSSSPCDVTDILKKRELILEKIKRMHEKNNNFFKGIIKKIKKIQKIIK
jgi:hypothetical protein